MHVEKKRIFIGNLPVNTKEAELKKKFENYGEVLSVEVKQRNESSVFAFVDLNINPNDLNTCFRGLKQREWKGHDVTLELARESFLSRLQRERQQLQQSEPTAATEQPGGAVEDEAPRKGRLRMFGGTQLVLGNKRKSVAAEPDVLARLENFSEVWQDDRASRTDSPVKKKKKKASAVEAVSESHIPVENGSISEGAMVGQEVPSAVQRRRKSMHQPVSASVQPESTAAVDQLDGPADAEEVPHKGRLFMFGGTKRARGETSAKNKSKKLAAEHDVLNRLDNSSDVSSTGSPLKGSKRKTLAADKTLKSQQKHDLVPVENGLSDEMVVKDLSSPKQKKQKLLDKKQRLSSKQDILDQSALASVQLQSRATEEDSSRLHLEGASVVAGETSVKEKRKTTSTEHGVLNRLEDFSDVWRDDRLSSTGNALMKKNQQKSLTIEKPLKSNKIPERKAVLNGAISEDKIVEKNSALSEQKRLKSLDEKKRIFNEKKKFIQAALASVDGKQTLNKKIVFHSDESGEEADEPLVTAELPGVSRAALFDDDDGDDWDNHNNFSISRHFEGEKGQKLLELQSRYGNDERFKLDERFRDDEQTQNEKLSEQEDEQVQNLKILGSVLGHEIPVEDKKKPKHASKPMLRFDPTKPDHVKYEVKKTPATVDGSAKKKKGAAEKKPVSKEKFYRVIESLKTSFQKTGENGTFSLRKMFGSDDDEATEDTTQPYSSTVDRAASKKVWKSKGSFNFESSNQEEYGGGNNKIADEAPSVPQKLFTREMSPMEGNTFFFQPDDPRLREGVEFFNHKRHNTTRIENFPEYRRNLKRWVKIKAKRSQLEMQTKKKKKQQFSRKVKKIRSKNR